MKDIIPYSRQEITENDIKSVSDVLRSDLLTQGPRLIQFEKLLCELLKVKYAIASSSGTAALHLAYAGSGARKGSLSIVPAITFSATANAMLYCGGDIQFCDVDPKTGLICPESLQSTIRNQNQNNSKAQRFIAPVSLSGATPPLDICSEIAKRFDYKLIEDASHSIISYSVNSSGDKIFSASCKYTESACLSFHPVKQLCCGEGGAVLTNSKNLADKITRMRSHGMTRPNSPSHPTPWYYEQIELGWNYRLNEMQAALGCSQIKRIRAGLKRRKELAKRYNMALKKKPFRENLCLPLHDEGHSLHLYVIHLNSSKLRDEFHKFLKSKGIMTQVHYIPLYRHPFFKRILGDVKLPGAEEYYKGCLSIPLFPSMSNCDQDRVIEEMASFFS